MYDIRFQKNDFSATVLKSSSASSIKAFVRAHSHSTYARRGGGGRERSNKIVRHACNCFVSCFFMKLLIGYVKRFLLEMGRGGVGKSTYAIVGGVVASVRLRTMGEGRGSDPCHFNANVIIE